MKSLDVLEAAHDELRAGMDWYDDQRFGLGWELKAEIQAAFDRIQQSPNLGSPYRDTPLRWVKTRRFPYVVYYRELSETILIVAIAHERRRPDYWLERVADDG